MALLCNPPMSRDMSKKIQLGQFSRSRSVDAKVNCDRCNSKFSLNTNPVTTCTSCKILVCKECREEGKTVRENDGWLCKVCLNDRLDISFLQLYIGTWPLLQKLANACQPLFRALSPVTWRGVLSTRTSLNCQEVTRGWYQVFVFGNVLG